MSGTAVVVIGIGNPFRGDDGVGPAVVALLQGRVGADVRLVSSDGEATRLLDAWSGVDDVVVVDAVHGGGAAPGSVHRWELRPASGPAPPRTVAGSTHALGLAAALALAEALGRRPRRLVLHGIQISVPGWGQRLTARAAAGAVEVSELIRAELRGRDEALCRPDIRL